MTALSAQAGVVTMTSDDLVSMQVRTSQCSISSYTLLLHTLKLIPIEARDSALCLLSLQVLVDCNLKLLEADRLELMSAKLRRILSPLPPQSTALSPQHFCLVQHHSNCCSPTRILLCLLHP